MACGCGKKHGKDPATAAVVGKVNGATPQLGKFTVNIAGVQPGKEVWVTGSYVDQAVEKGYLKLVESQPA